MIDWIYKNKEWLFSGVGVVIFAGGLSFVVKIMNRKRGTKASTSLSRSTSTNGIETYRGFILVNINNCEYKVFYPAAFDKTPNLTIYAKNDVKYVLKEERPDGFVLNIERFSLLRIRDKVRGGFLIKWQAWGRIAKQ